jgi:hypothetical protein
MSRRTLSARRFSIRGTHARSPDTDADADVCSSYADFRVHPNSGRVPVAVPHAAPALIASRHPRPAPHRSRLRAGTLPPLTIWYAYSSFPPFDE